MVSDDVLARRAARGDERAFAQLFHRYQPRLEGYCRTILHNDEDARDATQLALIKAFAALPSRREDSAVRAWLYRIARNEAISLMRRRRSHAALAETLEAHDQGPAEAAMVREQLDAMLAGVRELPPRAQQALLLREIGDLDYAGVGDVLGITANNARQAVFEARNALAADRDGWLESCSQIRLELSEGGRLRRPSRKARGHLRGCAPCRSWSEAQGRRLRARLGLLPIPALGSVWAWLGGLFGGGATGGAVGASAGGVTLGTKMLAAAAVVAAGAAPLAVTEEVRRAAPEAAVAATTTTPAAAKASAAAPATAPATAPAPAPSESVATNAAAREETATVAEREPAVEREEPAEEQREETQREAPYGEHRRPSGEDQRERARQEAPVYAPQQLTEQPRDDRHHEQRPPHREAYALRADGTADADSPLRENRHHRDRPPDPEAPAPAP
jgi:RNA polymerase sigma factor (sigma-70 family)